MSATPVLVSSTLRWNKLPQYLGGAVLLATVLGFVGYAAAVSYAAIFNIRTVDAVKIGTHTFFVTGALSVIGAFALLAARA